MGIMKSVRNGVAKIVGAKLREDLLTDYQGDDEPTHKYYRKLGGGRGGFRSAQRDLRSSLQEEQNKQAFKAFLENPFIRRLAKMTAEFIVGNGVSVRSEDPKVQAELDEWWSDPVNDMDRRHFQLALELPLYGEVVLERVTNVFTGRHRYNALDPLFVRQVRPHRKYPAIPAELEFSSQAGEVILGKIINGVPEASILGMKQTLDDLPLCFYFRTNNLSGALRGHSNYYPLLEWADVLDNAAFTMGERMVLLLNFVWHLKADNLDGQTKEKYKQLLSEANPGSALVTGKNIDLTAVTPDLKSADFTEGARFIRNLIAGSAGIPEHWMGEGGDVNRATAMAMDLPTLRSFLQQQQEFVTMIRTLARANLVSVAGRGRIPMEEVDNFTVQVTPIATKDMGALASSLSTLMGALSNAKMEGWISDQDARNMVRNMLDGVVELEEDATGEAPEEELPAEVQAAMDRLRKGFAGGYDEEEEEGANNGTPNRSAL